MKKMDELLDKQAELVEQLNMDRNKAKKTEQSLESISKQIQDLKEHYDYGSFKFVHANMPAIIQKVAPKHKVPPPRELNISSASDDSSMAASIPWADGECSDKDPCNVNVCPRCTLIHFQRVLDRLLAGYYSK